MKNQNYVFVITLGASLVAATLTMPSGDPIFQSSVAQEEEEEIRIDPTGVNMTRNITATEESIPTANTTGADPVIINSQMTD